MAKQKANLVVDPWQQMAGQQTMQAVPMESVLAGLHVKGREAASVRKELLAEINRLDDCGGRVAEGGIETQIARKRINTT
jgi:hypothetical protein